VDLQDDKQADQWRLLLQSCDADLGTTAPDWLAARDAIVRLLGRGESVNLVVRGEPKWRALLAGGVLYLHFLPYLLVLAVLGRLVTQVATYEARVVRGG
jgi:hypothetical protein